MLLIYSWWKRIQSHRECVLGPGGCSIIGLMTYGSILERTREVTLGHTLNCAFLWFYCVSKTTLTKQMNSKMTRGKWWPVLSERLDSENGFMRMIRAMRTVPGILYRGLSPTRKIVRLWFLPILAEGPTGIFVCFLCTSGIESRALSMLGKYSATKLHFPSHISCCRLRQIFTQLPRPILNLLCPTQALNLCSSC